MAFTNRTFELLSQLEQNGKYSFYQENKDEFRKYLVQPFRELIVEGVLPQLPDEIVNSLETQKRLFGQINKNDFGRGGANPFYWAAFYPKRSKNKQQDVQLLTFINHKYIEFGCFFGHQCSLERQVKYVDNVRHLRQSKSDYDRVIDFLCEQFPEDTLLFRDSDYEIAGEGVRGDVFAWRDYFSIEDIAACNPMVVYSREAVLSITMQELADRISATFAGLFPLVILAIHSNPLPILRSYIEAHN